MRGLLHKLLLSSLLIALLPMGLAIPWTSKTLSMLLERRFAEKARAQAEQVKILLSEKRETATGLVQWIAEMPGVRDSLVRGDRAALFQHLLPLVGSIEMDFIEILDPQGRIFLRVHDPSRFGDRPVLAADIRGLLQGMRDRPNYGVEQRGGKAYLRAAETIEDNGVLGVVSAGYALNADFMKRLEQVGGGKVVITAGDHTYSAGGQIAAPPPEPPAPLTAGEPRWQRQEPLASLEIRLPLKIDGDREGAISLLFPSREMKAAIGTLQKTLFSVALLGIILALGISWMLGRRLTRPLMALANATEQVAAGDFAGDVKIDSRDEIGSLAASFNRMLEELRRSKAEAEGYRKELERKFAERGEELAETETKRATMAHMIAHDLKNPLLGIKKTLERLEQAASDMDAQSTKKTLQELVSAGDLVIGMVNEMLDLYRSDFGELPLSLSALPIDEVIQTSLRILAPELEEKGLRVRRPPQADRIFVVADRKRLTRLVTNLLSNAIKFSPARGQITISTALTAGQAAPRLLLCVEDQGAGLPEQDLAKIFDLFYSRDPGKTETGTGLGLPYCKLVAEAHGGKIWAESRDSGGFAVSVLLPANLDAESRVDAP